MMSGLAAVASGDLVASGLLASGLASTLVSLGTPKAGRSELLAAGEAVLLDVGADVAGAAAVGADAAGSLAAGALVADGLAVEG
jgi:hypothetical protein